MVTKKSFWVCSCCQSLQPLLQGSTPSSRGTPPSPEEQPPSPGEHPFLQGSTPFSREQSPSPALQLLHLPSDPLSWLFLEPLGWASFPPVAPQTAVQMEHKVPKTKELVCCEAPLTGGSREAGPARCYISLQPSRASLPLPG